MKKFLHSQTQQLFISLFIIIMSICDWDRFHAETHLFRT